MPRTALAIDIGATTITATVRDQHGRVANLPVGGTLTPSSLLVVDRGRPRTAHLSDPLTMQQLGTLIDRLDTESIVIGGVAWSTTTLVEVALKPVLSAATEVLGQPPDRLVLVVPFSWDEDRRLRLQRAVHGAVHRPTMTISSDKAIAYAVPAPAIGEHRIVIDCGASALAAVMLGGGRRGPRVVARASVDSGGDIFDRVLLADALHREGFPDLVMDAKWAFAGVPRVRAGREKLADHDAVQIALPNPVGHIVLSSAAVDTTGSEYFTLALDNLFTMLTSDTDMVAAACGRSLLLHGGLSYDPAVAAAARPRSEAGVQVLPQPQHLLCRGALAFEAADYDSTNDPDPAPTQPAAPEHDHNDDEHHSWSKRALAIYGGIGALVVTVAVGGGLALSSAMTGTADARDSELPQIATAVLPASSSISGTTVKNWATGGDSDDPTMRSLSGDRLETLSCGGDQRAGGAEADGLRWSSSRVFVSDADVAGDTAKSWESFDPSATENVIVTAAIVSREDRDSVWQAINRANGRCPSTKDDLVRTIVVVPQDGPDPGPPTYSTSLPSAGTTTTPTENGATPTPEQGGITMSHERQAWRGIIPTSNSGADTDMNVTCVLDIDGIVLKRSCATAETSAAADKLAQAAAAAFNPTPKEHR